MGNPWALTEWQKEIDSYLIKTFDVVIVWKVDRFRVGASQRGANSRTSVPLGF